MLNYYTFIFNEAELRGIYPIEIKNKKQIVNNPPRWNGIVIATLFFPELKEKVYQLDELINYQNLLFLEICSLEELTQKLETQKLFMENLKSTTKLIKDISDISQQIMIDFSKND
ncbi:hypothetical protein EST62_10605 [Chlorobaculum sp. 24CR]|uniref:hypothetical protein n=1 Tax=Chlorobaculum sp. 24CR TaxID=2508878 RepID=UPI00100BEAE4|nr:hypothetical protein [Chlorobaculum sp. 24CR]RXK82459.1 hypothetical protein EST62_10605 [Chlorobaculum sp. 24CR]